MKASPQKLYSYSSDRGRQSVWQLTCKISIAMVGDMPVIRAHFLLSYCTVGTTGEMTSVWDRGKKYATMYQNSDLCSPRNESAWPSSQFLHSCICERLIYSTPGSVCLLSSIKKGRPILGILYINLLQIHECGNWDTERYNSVLEITRLCSFIFGNT